MQTRNINILFCALVFMVKVASGGPPIAIDTIQRVDAVTFDREVLPILQKNCLACHSASEKQGELVLESPQSILKGGDTGPAVVAGRGAVSLLIRMASHQAATVMPPESNDVAAGNLSSQELGLIQLWIDQGARGTGGKDSMSPKQMRTLPKGITAVQAVTLTQDGQYVVFGRGNRIFLNHVPTGQLVTELVDPALASSSGGAHRDLVQSLTLNADGDLLASGGFREVKLWRRPKDVQKLNIATGGPASTMSISPDRKWIAANGPASTVRLFNAADGAAGPTLTGHTDVVTSLQFASDGQRLVSGSLDHSICVWNIADGSLAGRIETPTPVKAVELVSAENQTEWIVSGGGDNLLRLWQMPAAAPTKLASSRLDLERTVSSRDGRLLAMIDNIGTVKIIAVQSTAIPVIEQDIAAWKIEGGITSLDFVRKPGSPEPTSENLRECYNVLAGTPDGFVQLWSLSEQKLLDAWRGGIVAVRSVAGSVDGTMAVSGDEDGAMFVWNLNAAPSVPLEAATGEQFASTNTLLVARANQVIAAQSPRFLKHLDGNAQPIRRMAFHPDNQLVFAAAADGTLRGYSPQTGKATFSTDHGAAVNDLAVSIDGQFIATAGDNHVVRIWNASGGGAGPQQLTGFSGPVHRVAFLADGKQILAVSNGDKPAAQVHDLQTGALLQKFSDHAGVAVGCAMLAVNPDADPNSTPTIALTASPGGVFQWNVAAIKQIPGHGGPVTSLARIPQNPRQVFSGSTDTTIRRWNLDNGQQMQQYNHGGVVVAIAVAPDVQRIASASDNHTARLFNIDGQQIAEMRGDVRRRIALSRAQQQESAATTRLNVAKQLADAAEKDLPVKTTAEKTLTDMLTAATTDVQTKKTAMETAFTEKNASEKAAIDASAAAKTALVARQHAEQSAKLAAAETLLAQARLGRLQQASNSEPLNEELKAKVIVAQTQLEAATLHSAAMAAAVQAPTDNATAMSTLANAAAQKLATVQKPYNDAVAALKLAESTKNLLSQQQILAARELTTAQATVPIRKDAVTRSEALLADAKTAVTAATAQLQESDLPLYSITFSPDGSILATSGDYSNVHTWDARTGAALGAFAGHTSRIKAVAFADDHTLMSASADQSIRFWDTNPGWVLERTIGNIDDPDMVAHRVTSVDFNTDSSQLLIASGIPSRRGELQVFNVTDGSRILYLPQAHDDVIYAAKFSPDGKRIASGGADKYLRTFEISSSQQLRRYEGHTSYVLGVAWKRDGQVIATSGADNTIKVWDVETGDQQRTIENFGRHVTSVHYIGETDNIISSCGDKLVRIHNATNGGLVRNLGDVTTWLHTIAITPDNSIAAAGDASGNVYVWNANNGQQLKKLGPVAP